MHDLPLDEFPFEDYRFVPLSSVWLILAVVGWQALLAAAFFLGMVLGLSG